ncbi:serine/threonine-protein phosphatase 6 regulatory subunit 2a isoform X1 [Myxocyprinus asiaticus]|uniref:serine/threonine-protein phosphatase 6 regulatory subunit 2a isoform X1 n=1 Tax=Myxocyprinus asiaticus TaxID=70543 RepID=UPI002223B5E8|nr:serine/threonine-protein phosphatase 6 regulatory subunit 2a isoform X1 [Myxocyprinus asiaticus]XP_051543915.1 serine/threonine-protein phosphatase 6 regulatory subunit 2a isoform X1 [Myxocyprinus asiaticus]
MFWKFDLNNTSHIDQLLDREDVTLRELMEEEDVLQECKAQNRKLLLFLSKDHCMQELVTLITEEPPADLEEKTRFKLPNIACELLTSDVALINDKLGGDESLLEKLYHFLEQEPPLNPLLASFFSKTIGNLIARKTDQVISFLRKKHNFISLVLNHIDASAMMDLLLRLISCVEPAPLRMDVLNWLNEERLIQRLTELMHTGRDEERQSNASQTLCDIIRLSRDQANQLSEVTEPDPLLAVLESQENVAELLKNMFEGERTEASVVNGTQVLLTLLESRRSGLEGLMDLYSQGCERSYTVNSSILRAIEPHLKDFQQLLLNPPMRSAILTTVGILEQPLGSARLHVARLVASLLQTCDLSICQEICRLNTMDLLLDLFFKYTWNNFLHLQVELCVASIMNHSAHTDLQNPGLQNHEERPAMDTGSQAQEGTPGQNSNSDPATTPIQDALVANLFQHCRLVQRILDAWEENEKIQLPCRNKSVGQIIPGWGSVVGIKGSGHLSVLNKGFFLTNLIARFLNTSSKDIIFSHDLHFFYQNHGDSTVEKECSPLTTNLVTALWNSSTFSFVKVAFFAKGWSDWGRGRPHCQLMSASCRTRCIPLLRSLSRVHKCFIRAEGGRRRGNMGHLTRIANTVVQNLEKGLAHSQINDLIKELPEDCRGRWESFVGETLRETNRRNTVDLVSTHNLHSSSEDDDMESPFPNDLSIQQAFSDYQIQQMTANFVDQFGFNDEEFSEHDENINAAFDRIAEINFNIDADDHSANAAAFEACCKERIQQFNDCEEEEDIWDEKEINYATQIKSRTRFGVSLSSDSSPRSAVKNGGGGCRSASEEEDVEEESSPPSTHTAAGRTPESLQNPGWTTSFGETEESSSSAWGASPQQGGEGQQETGWATFTEFQPFSSTESRQTDGQPQQGQEKNSAGGGSATGAWEASPEQKAPLVASDSSSSGGSGTEEDPGENKTKGSSKTAASQTTPPTSGVSTEALEKLSINDRADCSESSAPTEDSDTTVMETRVEAPSSAEITPNGPV